MTVMLVVLAVWAAISLVLGLTVGRAIRQADSAEFPVRPAEWWVKPSAASTAPDAAPAVDAPAGGTPGPDQVSHAV